MATRICKACKGYGHVDINDVAEGVKCTACNGTGQIVIETRRREKLPQPPEDDMNPKDLAARRKVSITKLPTIATVYGGLAMMDGARKYGPYNWREKQVFATVYIDAALRHLSCWLEGEEVASDSGVHHLGHVIGCCAILLDAQACGKLVDDRPRGGPNISALLKLLSDILTQDRPVIERVDPYQGTDK